MAGSRLGPASSSNPPVVKEVRSLPTMDFICSLIIVFTLCRPDRAAGCATSSVALGMCLVYYSIFIPRQAVCNFCGSIGGSLARLSGCHSSRARWRVRRLGFFSSRPPRRISSVTLQEECWRLGRSSQRQLRAYGQERGYRRPQQVLRSLLYGRFSSLSVRCRVRNFSCHCYPSSWQRLDSLAERLTHGKHTPFTAGSRR